MKKSGSGQSLRQQLSVSESVAAAQPVQQFKAPDAVNGITQAENQAVHELSGGKVDLHSSGASVTETSTSDSRLKDVGARSMAVGGEALIGDSRDRGHEIWHLAQQHMGMVQPNTSVNGQPVNNDPKLEKQADDYGAKIMQAKALPSFAQSVQTKKY